MKKIVKPTLAAEVLREIALLQNKQMAAVAAALVAEAVLLLTGTHISQGDQTAILGALAFAGAFARYMEKRAAAKREPASAPAQPASVQMPAPSGVPHLTPSGTVAPASAPVVNPAPVPPSDHPVNS